MKRSIPAILAFLYLSTFAGAQESPLKAYIHTALESNVALQRQGLSYEKSLAALEEAKALFFPRLSIQARYSVARGGRAFTIPIGDLMNPVYQNLNQINTLARATYPDYPTVPEYPMINNENINFLRETEQETVLRLQMPIFNQAILQNQRIRHNLAEAENVSVDIYRRELVKEVKVAYFNHAQARQGVRILEDALALVEENLRTSESLQRNHKVTLDVVYSARAEVEEVEQQLAEAVKNEKTAKAYFNFLLNRNYEEEIVPMPEEVLAPSAISLEEARNQAFRQREEFQQLNYYLAAQDKQIQLSKGAHLPQLNLQADYGIQGTRYEINDDADFFMGSVVMGWNLFDRSTKAKVQQARIEKLETESQKAELNQQIGLQVVNTFYGLEAAQQRILKAEAEVVAARQAFRLMNKKFMQGQANRVEFTNARTQQTSAEQRLSIARYDYQAKLAEFERATAGYRFD
ncbi:MAG: TolC family protein [Lewinellaceae bacterium]|nr:TolC family protein [Phaeodactylibacter sp.]MCB9348655.1 TolC family protein [Lewinellaceae bacterium]